MNLNNNNRRKKDLVARGQRFFSHVNPDSPKLLWFFPAYLAAFLFVERINTNVVYHNTACSLDRLIPFNELFVIPYFIWHILIVVVVVLTLSHDDWTYRKLMKFFIYGSVVCFLIFLLYPSYIDLRPVTFSRDNLLVDICKLLYSLDTPTNVCPSMHVVFSFGMFFAVIENRDTSVLDKFCMLIIVGFIVLSTLFLKQHAVIDVVVAVPVTIITWRLSFYEKPIKSCRSSIWGRS